LEGARQETAAWCTALIWSESCRQLSKEQAWVSRGPVCVYSEQSKRNLCAECMYTLGVNDKWINGLSWIMQTQVFLSCVYLQL
jgi:hypothetical protein